MYTYCPNCGNQVPMGAQQCYRCGTWIQQPQYQQQYQPQYPQQNQYPPYGQQVPVSSKNKVVAALLAFFLGCFGIHEFYLGRTGAGVAFLLVTLLIGWLVVPLVVVGIICIIQMIQYLTMSDQELAAKYH